MPPAGAYLRQETTMKNPATTRTLPNEDAPAQRTEEEK